MLLDSSPLALRAAPAALLSIYNQRDGIFVIAINASTGLIADGATPLPLARRPAADNGAIEASFVVYQPTSSSYFLFASFDKCCAGNASTVRDALPVYL